MIKSVVVCVVIMGSPTDADKVKLFPFEYSLKPEPISIWSKLIWACVDFEKQQAQIDVRINKKLVMKGLLLNLLQY